MIFQIWFEQDTNLSDKWFLSVDNNKFIIVFVLLESVQLIIIELLLLLSLFDRYVSKVCIDSNDIDFGLCIVNDVNNSLCRNVYQLLQLPYIWEGL